MSNEKIKCDYCKEEVKEQKGDKPTWFGRYKNQVRTKVICDECLPNNRENWREGK